MRRLTTLGALAAGLACGIFTALFWHPLLVMPAVFISILFFVVDVPAMRALIRKHGFVGAAFTRTYFVDVLPSQTIRMVVFGVSWLLTAALVIRLLSRDL